MYISALWNLLQHIIATLLLAVSVFKSPLYCGVSPMFKLMLMPQLVYLLENINCKANICAKSIPKFKYMYVLYFYKFFFYFGVLVFIWL
jgi:hypothetical protein